MFSSHGGHLTNAVNEDINYKHLGVNCNKYLNIDTNIKEASDKLKGTFMSLVKCGLIHSDIYIR